MNNINITTYLPIYKKAFKDLNTEWIAQYFKMEEYDYLVLDNPQKYILDTGGEIFVALKDNVAVGVCALQIRNDIEYTYELSKMAVLPAAQGNGIGLLLAQAIIKKVQQLGGTHVYIESNTILQPAINMYYKLGFKKIENGVSKFARGNINMVLALS